MIARGAILFLDAYYPVGHQASRIAAGDKAHPVGSADCLSACDVVRTKESVDPVVSSDVSISGAGIVELAHAGVTCGQELIDRLHGSSFRAGQLLAHEHLQR